MRAAPPPGAAPDRAGAVVGTTGPVAGYDPGAGHEAPPPVRVPDCRTRGTATAWPSPVSGHAAEPKNCMPSPGGLKVKTPPSEATIQ